MLGKECFLVDKEGDIPRPDVFKAIFNGFLIDTKHMVEEGKSKIIDIWTHLNFNNNLKR